MERKVGEVFYDGENKIEVVKTYGCVGCFYHDVDCSKKNSNRYNIAGLCARMDRNDNQSVKFIKIGEEKMKNKEELLKRIEEVEQRRKDDEKTLQEMRKQVEEMGKEVEVSATGVYLGGQNDKPYYTIFGNNIVEKDFGNRETAKKRFELNNCFVTKEQAEQEALRREGQEFIRRCAMLWNKDNDWRKEKQIQQWFIDYDTEDCKLGIDNNTDYTNSGIYFDTSKLAERCIAELKKKYNDEQIKTIFGVRG